MWYVQLLTCIKDTRQKCEPTISTLVHNSSAMPFCPLYIPRAEEVVICLGRSSARTQLPMKETLPAQQSFSSYTLSTRAGRRQEVPWEAFTWEGGMRREVDGRRRSHHWNCHQRPTYILSLSSPSLKWLLTGLVIINVWIAIICPEQ